MEGKLKTLQLNYLANTREKEGHTPGETTLLAIPPIPRGIAHHSITTTTPLTPITGGTLRIKGGVEITSNSVTPGDTMVTRGVVKLADAHINLLGVPIDNGVSRLDVMKYLMFHYPGQKAIHPRTQIIV